MLGWYNRTMTHARFWWLSLIFLALLAACGPRGAVTEPPQPSPTPSPVLTPYHTPTWTPRPTLPLEPLPTPTWPTPTPWVHVIREGDTLLGIALQYGVSLEALQAANPGVDPGFLRVGATLVIPLSQENPAGLPTPTPVPLPWQDLACYPQADGGAWCFVAVRNTTETPLESLSALVRWGEQDAVAQALHNVLHPGQDTVLLAHLPAAGGEAQPKAYWLTSLQADPERLAARYIFGEATVLQADGLPGRLVRYRLQVTWPAQRAPRTLWVVGLGYAGDGRPVAARRWELVAEDLQAGPPLTLEVTLASAGPLLARTVWIVEGRP